MGGGPQVVEELRVLDNRLVRLEVGQLAGRLAESLELAAFRRLETGGLGVAQVLGQLL